MIVFICVVSVLIINLGLLLLAKKMSFSSSKRWGWMTAILTGLRLVIFFGTAHLLWRHEQKAAPVGIFIFAAGVLQMVLNVNLHIKGKI